MLRQTHLTELMDDPNVDSVALAHALQLIRRVNRTLGGTSSILHHLKRWSAGWPKNRPITLLDVATGSADIPEAICDWAAAAAQPIHIYALDNHAKTLTHAQRWTTARRSLPITFLRADALQLPFADSSVDYVLNSMFLHHLTNPQALASIAEMLRVARRGIIVNDLLRSLHAKLFIHLFTLNATPIDKHDARVSVAKAWTKSEVLAWSAALNAPWLRYHSHLFARFTLAGQRRQL